MSDYRIFLRNNLRRLRLACGFTQSNIAAVLGISRPTYSYYEIGKTTPDMETLAKLANIYGVSFEQLTMPEEQPDVGPHKMRAYHHPSERPQTIGDLTEEEKVLIARLRSGHGNDDT